jgi:hypothetical protein
MLYGSISQRLTTHFCDSVAGMGLMEAFLKGSYERLEGGGVKRSYPNFTSFQVKARQEGKLSRCSTK